MYPSDAKYTKDHEWIRAEGDTYVVGITAFAAEQLGDVTYVELPEVGTEFGISDEIATVESVKAASDIYSPVSGTVAAVNELLEDQPELVNEGPQEQGWFFKLANVNTSELNALMDANEYEKFTQEQVH
ncbi:MAG TPA: glycine cleavage system protein GcvH [Candidatus Hydrogenedentes bacterium]|nr:glycine cleavage system protein GcvH [Candidatus Hydrogenedentota bacterium]